MAQQWDVSDFKKGLKFEIDGQPYIMLECNFVKPGKGNAVYKCRIQNLLTGATLDRNWRGGERVDQADIETRKMQYLYADGDSYHFMDNTSFEQTHVNKENLGDAANWLYENCPVSVLLHNNKPIGVEPPMFVELQIVKTDPGVRGDTVSGGTKPATLSTGAIVNIPLFISEGEWIKVDTRTATYLERVKK